MGSMWFCGEKCFGEVAATKQEAEINDSFILFTVYLNQEKDKSKLFFTNVSRRGFHKHEKLALMEILVLEALLHQNEKSSNK